MLHIISFIEGFFSEAFPFTLIVLGGLYLTVKGGAFQFFGCPKSMVLFKNAIKNKKKGEISAYSAACTALSATVGTANIAGVAGAIAIGGAGAVFWMWITAFMGMAIKFGEITLSIIYRKKQRQKYLGGPMNYIKNPIATFLFLFSVLPAAFAGGNIVQVNAVVSSVNISFNLKLIFGALLAILTAITIKGGITTVGNVTEKIVPLMSVLYIVMSLGVIILNIEFLPQAFKMIVVGAFCPRAVTGGMVSSFFVTAFTGAARGVFSNEAGLGTSGMIHSAVKDASAFEQGFFGIFEVFIDTIVICTLTALTILCSRVNIDYGSVASSELVKTALTSVYGEASKPLLTIMLCFFAFSSVIGWFVYAEIAAEQLFGGKGKVIYKAIYPLGCIIGAVFTADLSWRLATFFNGLMLCANLPAVLFLADEFLKYKKGFIGNGKNNKINPTLKGK